MLDGIAGEFEGNVAPLLRDILDDTQKLLRQEFALAKVEVREDARKARAVLVYLAAASTALAMSVVFLGIACAHLLAFFIQGLALWVAFGSVALASACVGFVLMRIVTRKSRQIRIFPEETLTSLREGAEWIQGQSSL